MTRWLLRGLGAAVVLSILAAVLLRVVFFSFYRVPSGSMEPTVPVGRHVIVSKRSTPVRGDVAVFREPEHPEQEFIKRVVALPGEKVEVDDGKITIDGWPVPTCSAGTYSYGDDSGARTTGDLFVEFLGDAAYLVFIDGSGLGGHEGPWVVKPGEVWMMGDNRNNSYDSRKWFGGAGGGAPVDMIGGKVLTSAKPIVSSPTTQAAIDACLAKKPAVTTPPRR